MLGNFKNIVVRVRSSKEAKEVIWLFLLQGIDKLMPLLVIPYLMTTLGAKRYGYIGFSFAAISYLTLLVDFGFGLSASKRVAVASKNMSEVNRIATATFVSKILLLIMGAPVLFLIIYVVPTLRAYLITCVCMLPMAVASILSATWLYQGLGHIKLIALITSICKITILPLVFVLVKDESDYNIAALIQSGALFVAGFVSLSILFWKHWFAITKVFGKDILEEVKESFPLFLSGAATSVYTQLSTIILGVIVSPAAVGTYSAAERIIRTICFTIYSPISVAFYPKMALMGSIDYEGGKRLLKKLIKCVFVIMLVVFLTLFVFSPQIAIFIGSDYVGLNHLLQIMAITPLFISLGGIYGQFGLIALGNKETKIQFRNTYLSAAPISLLLVSILTWWFAETGAAVAMFLTELFVFISMVHYYFLGKIKCCF